MNNERLESLELEHNRVLDELDGINNRLVDLEQNNSRLEAKIESLESGSDWLLGIYDTYEFYKFVLNKYDAQLNN